MKPASRDTYPAAPADANAEALLSRLDGVQKSGSGWRARCPACGGRSRKLSIAESDNRVLVHCFGGCEPVDVLAAVGLTWANVMPPRSWPATPEERKRAQRAIREVGWASALAQLASDGCVLESAITTLAAGKELYDDDIARLRLANERIGKTANIFVDAAKRGLAVLK